ncbi:FUSC family protein [Microbacterium sp. R86528]|uniref:FUSC family protein n=1 Tax=Microbacterium sp. R86528 TaxID=3093864 RepID=UPI0037CB55F2
MRAPGGLQHLRLFAARHAHDPGRARLATAVGVSAGVLVSAIATFAVVRALDANTGLLAMSVVLSVQAGAVVQDRSAVGRMITAATLVPCAALAVTLALVLSSWRPAQMATFVALSGFTIWVRRFGARAAALGMVGFLAYFFTLFMRPSATELPAYFVVAIVAVAAQLAVRASLLISRPRHELNVLLKELRDASSEAIHAATHARHRTLGVYLARVDEIGQAIDSWRLDHESATNVEDEQQLLAMRALDARVDTEQVCFALRRATSEQTEAARVSQATACLTTILDARASTQRVAAASQSAARILERTESADEDGVPLLADLIAQAGIAHARLRQTKLPQIARPARAGSAASRDTLPAVKMTRRRWTPWREWAPTGRMAMQAMIAASIAVAAGEAISASRWYWAVLTAVVIFAGTTTRSGVLTRAYRRITGTVVGIGVGVAAVWLAGDNNAVLVAIAIVGVFGMLYFGAANYAQKSFFTTVMLVSMYKLLGVLDQSILETRIEEIIAGALIGVLSAYLILSSSSSPDLKLKINAYFDALDSALRSGQRNLHAADDRAAVLRCVHALERAEADLNQAVSQMAAAFLISRREREKSAMSLMLVSTRSVTRFAQSAITLSTSDVSNDDTRRAVSAIDDAVAIVLANSEQARTHLVGEGSASSDNSPSIGVLATVKSWPFAFTSAQTSAILALARVDWAIRTAAEPAVKRSTHHVAARHADDH